MYILHFTSESEQVSEFVLAQQSLQRTLLRGHCASNGRNCSPVIVIGVGYGELPSQKV